MGNRPTVVIFTWASLIRRIRDCCSLSYYNIGPNRRITKSVNSTLASIEQITSVGTSQNNMSAPAEQPKVEKSKFQIITFD